MNFLDIVELTPPQIDGIFRLADMLGADSSKPLLSGKTFLLFFPESSLRTRVTFEAGIRRLGGDCILFPPETLNKREALQDVIGYAENWADGMIVRHPNLALLRELARHSRIPVINAMTSENHPCEILADLYAIKQRREDFRELVYTFVGPPGNIGRTWMDVSRVLDLQFNHVCASTGRAAENSRNYRFYTELEDVLPETDVILTDSLPAEWRTSEYIDKYQITPARLKLAREHVMLNPCPPFFRGEEVHGDALLADAFVGYAFKKSLLVVQQAILLYCLFNGEG